MTYESPVGDSPNVLVVEDDRGVRELYEYWLNDGYTIETAPDLTTAYAKLMDPFDVIVLDRNLPDGHGSELLATIRTLGLDCQVVIVTAEKPAIDIVEMDFDDYLQKPVTRGELHATLSRVVEQKQFRDAIVEFNRLRTRLSLLEEHCTPSELAGNERYATVEARLEELRDDLSTTVHARPELPFDANLEMVSGD